MVITHLREATDASYIYNLSHRWIGAKRDDSPRHLTPQLREPVHDNFEFRRWNVDLARLSNHQESAAVGCNIIAAPEAHTSGDVGALK